MPGSFPQYSQIYPELAKLIKSRAGNNRPIQQGGVSGLSVWFRMISGVKSVKDGFILQTIGKPSGDFNTNYGGDSKSGVVGYTFDNTPLQVGGRGLRPSPVITSVSVDETAEGGSRITTVKITAFTSEQANLLASYFLEPGFHILCEWGWNVQKSIAQKCGDKNGKVTACAMAEYDKWTNIKQKRENSGYTYDAVLGIVVGGGMTFGDNETYELEVKLTGVGNVAEYMQTHRDANKTDSAIKDSSNTFNANQIDAAAEAKELGKALFMQMFNELPGQKRTDKVKNMAYDTKWADAANFVNMDKVVRESLADAMSDGAELKSEDSSKTAKIPKDIPIITTDRYIRFELAWQIINSYPVDLKPQDNKLCGKQSRDQRIQIENTICSGFPHMFSTDKTKLFIPNTTAPNFNLVTALSSTSEVTNFITFNELNQPTNLANLHPIGGPETPADTSNNSSQDFPNGPTRPVPYAFPARYNLEMEFANVDKSFKTIKEKAGFWGHLKNLYINFDFFVECISKPNFVVRDVMYEMLNGMSSACNSIWRFQIMETINPKTGDLQVSVVDLNFSGQVDVTDIFSFQARGVDSPFISCDFSVDTPGAMISSQVQKKLNSNIEHSPELNPRPMLGNVFSRNEDVVGTYLQGLKTLEETEKKTEQPTDNNQPVESKKSADELEQEARALNFEYYTKTGAVLPKVQDRNGKLDITKTFLDFNKSNDGTLESLLMVGAWNDTSALRQVFLIDKGLIKTVKGSQSRAENNKQNPPFGLASFNFRVHGVSGFKVGDKFRIDGLPGKFGAPNFFQIVKVDHSIEGMNWFTDVKGELRIIGNEK